MVPMGKISSDIQFIASSLDTHQTLCGVSLLQLTLVCVCGGGMQGEKP